MANPKGAMQEWMVRYMDGSAFETYRTGQFLPPDFGGFGAIAAAGALNGQQLLGMYIVEEGEQGRIVAYCGPIRSLLVRIGNIDEQTRQFPTVDHHPD